MAGSKTDEWANFVNGLIIGGSGFGYVPGATIYVALSSAVFDATKHDDAVGFNELSAGGYARLAVSNDRTSWSVSGATIARTLTNLIDLIFGAATADWPVILSAYLCANPVANTGGKLMYGADLLVPTGVPTGRAFVISVGNYAVTER